MAVVENAVGQEAQLSVTVQAGQSADAYGNSGLPALGSPALVGLVEMACMEALDQHLEDGERSVGSFIEIEHTAPTPVGARVDVQARIESVDGRKVWFAVSASDASGEIGRGRHARFVVDDQRFQARLANLRITVAPGEV